MCLAVAGHAGLAWRRGGLPSGSGLVVMDGRVWPWGAVPWSSGSTWLQAGFGVPAAFIRACGGGGAAHAQKRVLPEDTASFSPGHTTPAPSASRVTDRPLVASRARRWATTRGARSA